MESSNTEISSLPIEQIELISPENLTNTDLTKIININTGILGHVDSGKTSLSKLISQLASTAAFDKNPQSKERGITLDLGFSALYIKTPNYLKLKFPNNKKITESDFIQITLVDCPGHASLIRTVIAGASIIDTALLVIDIMKGIQTQTVECIAISEILCDKISIVLNKIDLVNNKEDIEKKSNKLKQIFSKTKFGNNIPIIPISTINIEEKENKVKLIIKSIIDCVNFDLSEKNNNKESLITYIDHCFKIKNKGTVVTGTIIQGNIKINDEVFFPELSNKFTVKEIQVFKKSVKMASKGDRVGLLIKNLDKEKIERSIITSVDSKDVNYLQGGLFVLKKINLYKDDLKSNNKYYFMIGNQGISGKCIFFDYVNNKEKDLFTMYDIKNIKNTKVIEKNNFYEKEFNYLEKIDVSSNNEYFFAVVKFDKKILVPNKMIFLGTNIDIDISENKKDRLAFYGKIIGNDLSEITEKLKIIKNKMKEGKIIRVLEDNKTAIVKGLIKKENMANVNNFIGKEIYGREENEKINEEDKKEEDKLVGKILSSFGQVGKLKVEFNKEIDPKNFKNIILEMPIKKYVKLGKI